MSITYTLGVEQEFELQSGKDRSLVDLLLARSQDRPAHGAERARPEQVEWVANPEPDKILVRGARQHNLKNIDVAIPREQFVVLTGVSGSGKSSLAFDTIYAEGQRRYVESLSPFVRSFLDQAEKPKVDLIYGLNPAVAIEQKMVSNNRRSSVGTLTEVMSYLRLLYARVGVARCLACGRTLWQWTPSQIVDRLAVLPPGVRFRLLAPILYRSVEPYRSVVRHALREGYTHARVDGVPDVALADLELDRKEAHTIDLTVADCESPAKSSKRWHERTLASVKTALTWGDGLVTVDLGGGDEVVFGERLVCGSCGALFPALVSSHFSPNSPLGMCEACNGLGTKLEVDPERIIVDPTRSLVDGALRKGMAGHGKWLARGVARRYGVDLDCPWNELPEEVRDAFLYGYHSKSRHRRYPGLVERIDNLFHKTRSERAKQQYAAFMSQQVCPACEGTRLSPVGRAVTVGGKTIAEVGERTIDQVLDWVDGLYDTLDDETFAVASEVLKEASQRLQFMLSVGLHYLSLDRPAPTLSAGEGQRIRLAKQLGCGLVGVLYVLDEPSIGLHTRDHGKLLDTLFYLRDMGNTVLVVEHDEQTMRRADWLIDLGPGAGILGGEVVIAGTPAQVAAEPSSLTGRYLSGELSVASPNGRHRREPACGWFGVVGATLHNLKRIEARFPVGLLTCVTGVSGSGKSSLVNETLYPALRQALHRAQDKGRAGSHERLEGVSRLDKVINITQDPIGRTPRSNPATYVGLFDEIRTLFSGTDEAIARGYDPGRFSFNVEGGRCESCKGYGRKRVEMHFLPDVWVTCKECGGTRYNGDTLAVRYKGRNIAEVLDMDVQEALSFFDHPKIARILETLHDVGLDYIKLGQSATTLSGGEAQRIKLSRELSRPGTGRTLYILDEPTTGLHFADIQRLLDVLHRLVDAGNTAIVIEHNVEVIKTADWVIDLGPEGGDAGGYIVAQGTPEEVAQVDASYTGRFLRRVLGTC
jgi:excinuclease ABC subunit A